MRVAADGWHGWVWRSGWDSICIQSGTAALCGPTAWCSAAASALHKATSKKQRSRARSGQLQHRVRRSSRQSSACLPHVPTTPAWYHACTTSVNLEPRQKGITRGTTGLNLNHTHLESRCPERAISTTGDRTTPCITGNQHNGRPYHTLHNGLLHDGAGTTGVWEARFASIHIKKGCQRRSLDAERAALKLPPRRAA